MYLSKVCPLFRRVQNDIPKATGLLSVRGNLYYQELINRQEDTVRFSSLVL